MKLLIVLSVVCLMGCEVSKVTKPETTTVKVDVGQRGVDVEIKKK